MASKKSIEQKYQKLTGREHVLHRPGMYIGSIKKQTEEMWCFKENKMEKCMIEYAPGFMKIFDEVLTNALDHSVRDPTLNTIKVDYDKSTGEISVWNNGTGIPVVEHSEHKMYVPELIFGHLLSGSNYDDNESRTGAGTNGLGSKCISDDTKVPLFNGEIKFANDIKIGDVLIGDDGTPRTVLNKTEGFGEMYKIIQHFGEDYVVNNNHTLTLHIPDHKVIFWNSYGWSALWWNNDKKSIETKFIKVFSENKKCPECDLVLNSSLSRHYRRMHKDKEIPKFSRKLPSYGNMDDPLVSQRYNEMKEFLKTVKYESVFDINIQDYLKLNKTTQRRLAGVRGNCVNWEYKDVELDPYILGLWLGDGCSNGYGYACDGVNDYQIIDYLKEWGVKNDANIKKGERYVYRFSSIENYKKKGCAPLKKLLNEYNLINNKHIPEEYLINSRDVRLKVLAGLIDTDGTVSRNGTRVIITQSYIHNDLVGDIIYLVRSLGFLCSVTSGMATYSYNGGKRESLAYYINISGNIEEIPTKLPRKKCNNTKKINTDKSTGYIRVQKVNDGKYIGIKIDGNERFLINDFTVTHNCTNIYSKKFIIETVDSENKKKFVQEHSENMSKKTKAKITSSSVKSYTKITFVPDYERFGMNGLEDDTISLINKRCYDCIACTGNNVSIYLNGNKLKGKGLADYIKYFVEDEKVIYENFEHNQFVWEYAIVPSEHYEQMSFVNGNETRNGGKHVDYILYQITNKLKTLLETKKKLKDVKPNFIKDKMFLFLRSTVINPAFNSQTKEQLTTASKDFGVSVTVSDKFIDKIYKSSIVEDIVEFCKLKESSELTKKTDGSKKNKLYGIPKLEDAVWAGTSKSESCTLILTEGLSAMTFALWGRSVVGPERYGVFPLKGKCNSEDTKIPLWNGDIKLAKDINIGDELIGDDGNKRKVLTLFKGHGKMYEISQDRGEPYKVNDEHILTLCIPEHKVIYWNNSSASWRALYWDKNSLTVKVKEVPIGIKVNCDECKSLISIKCLRKHYKRQHKNKPFVQKNYTNDTIENLKMKDPRVIQAYKKMEEFLSHVDDNNIIDICIQDYLKIPDSMKRKLKGIRGSCVNWEEKEVALDPYVLGLWLGDGMKEGRGYVCYGEKDPEIIDYLNKWCEKNDAFLEKKDFAKYLYSFHSKSDFGKMNSSPLRNLLKTYNLLNNKHIPKEYLINSSEVRLRVLAGIIDTDGFVTADGCIEIVQSHVHEQLAEDIIYLSRSLGFYTYVVKRDSKYTWNNEIKYSESYRIKISGDIDSIPTLLPRKKTKSTSKYNMRNSNGQIHVKEIEDGNYVGIGIDSNNRFLINDFTITHNCINVRDATVSQLLNNEELNSIKQILGLKQNVDYKDTKSLRYGKVMILTDADVDGSHIKGLLVNMIHAFYPGLINLNFIQTMKTPIVKATKGKQVLEFFTEQDYKIWKDATGNTKNYNIKYFKGLGTSKKEDAQDLFKRLDTLRVDYYRKDAKCDESILLAFQKDKNVKDQEISCTDMRKKWLSNYDKSSYIDLKETKTCYQDFINKELIHFSIYDNLRSIPSLCDGLKPSQRKILYYMLKNNVNNDIKVAQLSGYISAEMAYHHGEVSLQGAIVNLSQNFVGSNNINLLVPEGNFGSRMNGGKDAASPRYIFTRLSQLTTHIFNTSDNNLYNYLEDDNLPIEPEYMLPIIPMVLVNGCEGIATGYSTYIPCYNPSDIITNLLNLLTDKPLYKMIPYFKGFGGEVTECENGSYMTKGKWKRINDTKIEITEIPVGMWVTQYKEFLESFIETSKNTVKKKFYFKDVQNMTKDENTGIHFIVEFKNAKDLKTLIDNDTLEKELKLCKSFSINNMYLFNTNLILTKYQSPLDIINEYYTIRLSFYEKRRLYIINKLTEELKVLKSKIRFIEEYIDGTLDINKKSKDYTIELLNKRKYHKVNGSGGEYDYLINLPVISFTSEKIKDLTNTHDKKVSELEYYQSKTDKELWVVDLNNLNKML